MKLDFTNLYNLQKELDRAIYIKHSLDEHNTINKRILALAVELGELANETRCFKYWSIKSPSQKNVILEEYVDGIHFLLSLGNTINAPKNLFIDDKAIKNNQDIVSTFISIFSLIDKFNNDLNIINFQKLFSEYFLLGKLLGFTFEEIEKGYLLKNKENHQRQKTNY